MKGVSSPGEHPGGSAALTLQPSLPLWAMQRVATIIESEPRDLTLRTDAVRLARRTGLSKSLARRCLRQLEKQKVIISPS